MEKISKEEAMEAFMADLKAVLKKHKVEISLCDHSRGYDTWQTLQLEFDSIIDHDTYTIEREYFSVDMSGSIVADD